MPERRANRQGVVGRILLMSAGVLGLVAVLVGSGALPISGVGGPIVAAALGAAAFVEVLIGLRFLLSSGE
jgi:hypothetical protein